MQTPMLMRGWRAIMLVVVTFAAILGGVTVASLASAVTAPINTSAPTITAPTGDRYFMGKKLTATAGTWDSGTYSYQWYRCTADVASSSSTLDSSCWAIEANSTSSTYVLTPSEVGFRVIVGVTATSVDGTATVYSASTPWIRKSRIIAAGKDFTCAIKTGQVYCWGANSQNQTGQNGTTTPQKNVTGPVLKPDGTPLSNVVSVMSGAFAKSCAVTLDKYAYCWGYNLGGEFSQGSTTAVATANRAVQVLSAANTPLTNVVDVAMSYYNICYVTDQGAIWCNGNTASTTGANGATNTGYVQRVLKSATAGDYLTGVQQASGANDAMCAIAGGSLYCWGYSTYGHFQQSSGATVTALYAVAPQTTGATALSSHVTRIAVGWSGACAIKDGQAYCWGSQSQGALGNGTASSAVLNANVAVGWGANTSHLAYFDLDMTRENTGALDTMCLVAAGGRPYCTGYGNYGGLLQTGSTSSVSSLVASTIYSSNVTQISSDYHTCVVVATNPGEPGVATCSGNNTNGQLGNGTTVNSTTAKVSPTGVVSMDSIMGAFDVAPIISSFTPAAQPVAKVAISANSPTITGFPQPSAPTYQWNKCSAQVLASSSSRDASCSPISYGVGAEYSVSDSDIGSYFLLAMTARNEIGSTTSFSASSTYAAIGQTAVATVTSSGIARTGSSFTYTAGTWTGSPTSTGYTWYRCPVAIPVSTQTVPTNCISIPEAAGATSYTARPIDVGFYITVAESATYSSTVTAFAQSTNRVLPKRLAATTTDGAGCFLKGGKVYCAGTNQYGVLGINSTICTTSCTQKQTTANWTPVIKADGNPLTGVTSIYSGMADTSFPNTCAITTANLAYCWGRNNLGQLGDGTKVDKGVATPVTDGQGNVLTGVVDLALGTVSSCAIVNNSTYNYGLLCWGSNASGTLGRGTTDASWVADDYIAKVPTTAWNASLGPVDFSFGVQRVVAGNDAFCAIKLAAAFCWGKEMSPTSASLFGNTHTASQVFNTPQLVATWNSGVSDISLGSYHSCGIRNGQAYCWGQASWNEITVNGTTGGNSVTPIAISFSSGGTPAKPVLTSNLAEVKTARYFGGTVISNCFVTFAGAVYCEGRFGDAANTFSATNDSLLTQLPAPANAGVESVEIGGTVTCYTKADVVICAGNLTTWASAALYSASTAPLGTAVVASGAGPSVLTGQSISYSGASTIRLAGGDQALTGATATSGLAVTYSSTTPSVCTVLNGSTLHPVTNGTCLLTANQAGDSTYDAAAPVSIALSITAATLDYSVAASVSTAGSWGTQITGTAPTWIGNALTGTPTNQWFSCTSSGVAVGGVGSALATAPAGCIAINGETSLTYTPTGSDIGAYFRLAQTASNLDDSGTAQSYTSFSATTAAITKKAQIVSLGVIANRAVTSGDFTIAPTTDADSGIPVTVASSDATVCSVEANTIHVLAAGLCTLTASQAGDSL
ncbi:MAG: hypothetical protein RLZZ600_41, partial [Actinomycetota bacterium]